MRVAAFQNGYYVALCNRVGAEDRLTSPASRSSARPTARSSRAPRQDATTILYADIDLATAERSHARQLFLKHRRPELYGEWLNPRRV